MYTIKKGIESVCPYIQNRSPERKFVKTPEGKWTEWIEPTSRKKMVNPEDAGYHDENGYYIPARQIWASMRESSGQIQIGGSKLDRLSRFFKSCIRIQPDKIYINRREPDMIYNDPCFKESKKGGEMVYNPRPMFQSWNSEIEIIVLEDSISEDKVIECLVYAGLFKGIGARRPEYGRFILHQF